MNATGNRGDDFRSLKLAELQPYSMQHPVHNMKIFAILGLQGEEKAGKRGMRTVRSNITFIFQCLTEGPGRQPLLLGLHCE